MGWMARLKALDDRLLPRSSKTPSVKDYRRATVIGVVGVVTMTVAGFLIEAASFFGGAILLLVLTGMNVVRWRRLARAERDQHPPTPPCPVRPGGGAVRPF